MVLVPPPHRDLGLEIDEDTMDSLVVDDYIVRMPPVRAYTVRVKVKSVEKAIPPVVVLEDEMKDAMEICGHDFANELSDEALVEFERLIDQSAPPAVWVETLYWTLDDWIDWLMGR